MIERPVFSHPALELLTMRRWDDAFGWLLPVTTPVVGEERAKRVLIAFGDRYSMTSEILSLIEELYEVGSIFSGKLATAWQMLIVDPRRPRSFHPVMPQLQNALDTADIDEAVKTPLRDRIRIWWRGAEGAWTYSDVSIFRIADVETGGKTYDGGQYDAPIDAPRWVSQVEADYPLPEPEILGPHLVVMRKNKSTKLNNYNASFKEIVDAALPLVVAHDVSMIRAALHAEFPHAVTAVDLLMRDLREGRPVTLKPVLLLGSPGCGKSRMVRRLADILRAYVYRYDAASSSDCHFGGTSKAWSNTEPSVPARAVVQSKTANPIVMVDEIEKAAERNWNGRLWDAILPFLDPETASRYRDQSLDAELDLSRVSYIATANDDSKLPSPLRDRLRIIKVKTPSLRHLSPLAAQVMRDLAIEDEARSCDEPLAVDELDVIGKAWWKAGFSIRKLQKIVLATLEARDSLAPRH